MYYSAASQYYADAAYCYTQSIVRGLSVCHDEPCKYGKTDRDAVSVVGWGGPKEPYIRWGSRYPCEGQF